MALYLRIDDKKSYDWLKNIIQNWLNTDPNNVRLQVNFEHIYAWSQYLEHNIVTVKEVTDAIDADDLLATILPPDKLPKVTKKTPPPVETKRRGRPPTKQSLAVAKKKEIAAKRKSKIEKQKELESDPFRCKDHPTYGGKNKTSRDCDRCWEIYKTFHPAEYKQVRAAFERSLKRAANE